MEEVERVEKVVGDGVGDSLVDGEGDGLEVVSGSWLVVVGFEDEVVGGVLCSEVVVGVGLGLGLGVVSGVDVVSGVVCSGVDDGA